MPLLSRKGILAIAAVLDVALLARSRPVSAKILAERQKLPPRHLEPLLQSLVRDGILRGIRGPHGGYALGREDHEITASDILRAAHKADGDDIEQPGSPLIADVIRPVLASAECAFSDALACIRLSDMTARVPNMS